VRIAWVTPFAAESAIGRFSQAVTTELAKHADIDLWVSSRDNLLPTSLPIIDYNPDLPLDQWWPHGRYDFSVCNLGDHLGFHQRIFELSLKVPSILILHDFVMHHFFAGYYQVVLGNLDAHLLRVNARYGTRSKNLNELARAGKGPWIWETDEVVDFPMFEDCLPGALGVITHSRFFADRVRQVFPGPAQNIPLAYPVDRNSSLSPRDRLSLPEDRVVLLTVGNVNRNKRVDEVIECLAADRELAAKVFYVVCGHATPETTDRLNALLARSELQECVRLNGLTPVDELRSYFRAADICINLRNPAMEGGSASLVEMMLHGKAGIVSDTGVYAEMPDSCVKKIRPEHEKADLTRALNVLVVDANLREQLGASALAYAQQNFMPKAYAERLLQFLDEVSAVKPVLEPVYRAARILSEIGVDQNMDVSRTLAQTAADLFCGSAEEAPWNHD
jgi:glycosyltransferase involved in cell wall biosynthesis